MTTFFARSGDNSQVSWAYDWGYSTNMEELNPTLEFVPLLYNNNQDLFAAWPVAAEKAIAAGSTMLFSMNEPDFGSNYMDIPTAVATWLELMEPFAGKAKLVAPAVTNVGAPAGLTWLEQFLGNCSQCTIDAVNIHWYSNKWAGVSYLQQQVRAARALANGRDLILSEFGLDDSAGAYTEGDLMDFLEAALPWLDVQDDVIRYAYFMDAENYLVNAAGTSLSDSGVLYNNYTGVSSIVSSSVISPTSSPTGTTSVSSKSTDVTTIQRSSALPTSALTSSASPKIEFNTIAASSTMTSTAPLVSSGPATVSGSPTLPTSPPRIEILSAFFATENVTDGARSSFLQGGDMVVDTFSLAAVAGGDPWPGNIKTLTILYRLGNETLVFVATEQSGIYTIHASTGVASGTNGVVAADLADAGAPITLVGIVWGSTIISTASVWKRLYYQASTDWGFQISNDLFETDGMFGVVKSATIWYIKNGVLSAIGAKEYDWVLF